MTAKINKFMRPLLSAARKAAPAVSEDDCLKIITAALEQFAKGDPRMVEVIQDYLT